MTQSEWECFCDESYYGMWCVRKKGETAFGKGFHVPSADEGFALIEALEAKDARIAQLEKEKALAVEALENVNKVCLCTRGTKGFDYGQKHKLRGKAGVGERWNTPNYICVKALAQIKEMEK